MQDRLTRDTDAVWRINPRTGFLESRAGLSWTGVREYRTPQGLLRVLRRPEQVNSPGHLKTLRRLPCCEGHPNGGRDVVATNYDALGCGWTGDAITIENLGGYPRPVGDVSVSRLTTLVKMMSREAWEQYCRDFPDAAKLGIQHDGGKPRTGTSLGYNALWYGPYVDAEIVSERDDGSLVGEWQGPNGPEPYDVEHIVDPDCEVVQQLARNTGFNPELLGGNHFAVCLAALGGRGAEQSELMRVVDSAELPIVGDLARRLTRVALQVPMVKKRTQVQRRSAKSWRDAVVRTFDEVGSVDPAWAARQAELAQVLASGQTIPKCAITYGTNEFGVLETAFHFAGDAEPWTTVPAMPLDAITKEYIIDLYLWSRDPHDEILAPGGRQLPECTTDAEDWTVGASRDLNVVPGDWDGDAAAASVFRWAGFDGDEPKPDPAKARQAFLIYDANAPELKGSYRLPIAEYRDGGLRVVKGGLDAAAGYLPKTDAPKEVLDRARDVLDHYYAKWEEKQGAAAARDALPQRETTMNKINVEFGLGRDAAKALGKLAPTLKVPQTLVLTLDEGPDAKALMAKLAEMQEMCSDLIEMVGAAKGEAAMAEGKMEDMVPVAEAAKKVDEIKAALAEAEKALAESKAAEETAAAERDAAKKTCDALETELAPYRTAELQKFRDEIVALGFDKAAIDACPDAAAIRRHVAAIKIGERYSKTRDAANGAKEYVLGDDLVLSAFDGWRAAQAKPAPTRDAAPSRTFENFPRLTIQRDANNNEPAPTNTAAQTRAGMSCLG